MEPEDIHKASNNNKPTGKGSRGPEERPEFVPVDFETGELLAAGVWSHKYVHVETGEIFLTNGGLKLLTKYSIAAIRIRRENGQRDKHPDWSRAETVVAKYGDTWIQPAAVLNTLGEDAGVAMPVETLSQEELNALQSEISVVETHLAEALETNAEQAATISKLQEEAQVEAERHRDEVALKQNLIDAANSNVQAHQARIAEGEELLKQQRAAATNAAEQTRIANGRRDELERKLDRQGEVVRQAEFINNHFKGAKLSAFFKRRHRKTSELRLNDLADAIASNTVALNEGKATATTVEDTAEAVTKAMNEISAEVAADSPATEQKS